MWAERKRSGAGQTSGGVSGSQKKEVEHECGTAKRERSSKRRSEKSGLTRSGRSAPLRSHALVVRCQFWLTVDPPLSRSAPGPSAPRPPQTRSFRPKLRDDPPQVLGRSAPGRSAPTLRCKLGLTISKVKFNCHYTSCKKDKWRRATGWIAV